MNQPTTGSLLIANPHLNDPNFLRSVIFLCQKNEDGCFGFVLNRKTNYVVGDILPDLGSHKIPVYEGGPVELNTLHFLHQLPDLIPDGKEVCDGIYWGGDFDTLVALINEKSVDLKKVRFYLGYSGWDAGQIETEQDEKTWIVSDATKELVFSSNENNVWRDALRKLGGEYELIINAPIDPQLN